MLSGKESRVGVGFKPKQGSFEGIHPHALFTYLGLAGIFFIFSILIAAFVAAQLYTVGVTQTRLPASFVMSTAVLLLSSVTIWLACRAQKTEHYKATIAWLTATLSLGLLFLALQLIGWNALQLQGVYPIGSAAGSYMYLITGLHMLHVIAGLVFIIFVMSHVIKATIDAINSLIYSTDKYRILQLRMVSAYWHFITGIWLMVYLVLFLLTNS